MFKRLLYLIIISFLFLPLLSGEEFKTCLSQARESLNKGDRESARVSLEKGIKLWHKGDSIPLLAQAHADLGLILMTQEKLDKALEHYQKATKLNPKDSRTYFRMGLIYMARNQLPEAIKALDRTTRLNSKFTMGYQTLGDAYRRAHQHENAIKAYQKALALSEKPNDALLSGLGESLRVTNDYANAQKYLENAVSTNPDNAIAHYQLGLCYLSLKREKDAIIQFEGALKAKAIVQDSFKVQIITYLGQANEKSGNLDKAKECYQKAREILDNIPYESK